MINKLTNTIYIFITTILLSGCFGSNVSPMIQDNYNAAGMLIKKAQIDEGTIVIISTIVDINDLQNTTALGRTISEQLTSEFVNYGLKMLEMKLGKNVYIKEHTGELVLSRDITRIANKVKAEVLVAGTYSNTNDLVYINLKIINPKTSIILSTIDYTLQKDDNIKCLLNESFLCQEKF